jgi:hypothetical protein
MANGLSSLCDDLYLDMYVNTELSLPTQRDTILTFFEQIQKRFASMCSLYRREKNECYLEENRETGQYRWVGLETDRICSGVVNPADFEQAYEQHRFVLELIPYLLGVSHLDVDSLDVAFAMDFDYAGSHDEVIAEALFGSTAFSCLLDIPGAKPIGLSPVMVVGLCDECRTQARISIESKTSVHEPGKRPETADEAISLSFTIRCYPSGRAKFDALRSFENQCRIGEELMAERIIPNFVKPLANVIAQKRFI